MAEGGALRRGQSRKWNELTTSPSLLPALRALAPEIRGGLVNFPLMVKIADAFKLNAH